MAERRSTSSESEGSRKSPDIEEDEDGKRFTAIDLFLKGLFINGFPSTSSWIARYVDTCFKNWKEKDIPIEDSVSPSQMKEYKKFVKNNNVRLNQIGLDLESELLRLDCQDFYTKEPAEVSI